MILSGARRLRAIDLTGQRFGRLVVLRRISNRGERVRWLCACDCGNDTAVDPQCLRRGDTRSCGCLNAELSARRMTKHGHDRRSVETRAHIVWRRMKGRCLDKNDKGWPYYGGRGIRICDRWMDFSNFIEDMGNPPPGYSIERVDNDGDYCPENCVWTDKKTQNRNKRSVHTIILQGRKISVAEVCERLRISRTNISTYAGNPAHRMSYADALLAILARKRNITKVEALGALEEEALHWY